MTKLRFLTVVALVFGAVSLSAADTLQMDSTDPNASASRPTRGETTTSVEAKFGAPTAKQAAVGEPPISRWEYKEFVVFFEYDRVIHAVVKR